MTDVNSSPCAADTAGARPFEGDPQDFAQVRRWRNAERDRLRADRKALPGPARAAVTQAVIRHLDAFFTDHVPNLTGRVISGYWPIKNEPDLRDWFAGLRGKGAVIALPVPVSPPQPMTFRLWLPEVKLVPGFGNIPVPPEDAPQVTPGILFAPLIGWDDKGFRLGYGAGYFDRTLAGFTEPALALGVGYQSARIPTIVPQRHDVPMHAILTEAGVQVLRPPLPMTAGWA